MAQHHRGRQARNNRPAHRAPRGEPAPPPPPRVKAPPVVYGQPVVVLEDATKQTFVFEQGAWVPFGASIAECRRDSLVEQLPQKVNNMTRYTVRRPVGSGQE